MKKIGNLLMAALAIVVIFFCGDYLYERYQEIRLLEFQINYFLIILTFAFNCAYYLLLNDSWQKIVGMFSGNAALIPRGVLSRIFFVSFVSRYLPAGQLFMHGGRVEWLYRLGRDRTIGIASILYEQIYMLGGVALLVAAAVWFYPTSMFVGHFALNKPALAVSSLAFSVTCFLLPEWTLLFFARLQNRKSDSTPGRVLTLQQKIALMVRFLLNNIFQGLAAYFAILAVLPVRPANGLDAILVISAYPLSRLVGQLMVFVPGGIGVREGFFVFLLQQIFSLRSVLISAALMRFLTISLELVLAGISTLNVKKAERFKLFDQP